MMRGYIKAILKFKMHSVNKWPNMSKVEINMVFFKQMRIYFFFFIFFGLWSTWENLKYKLQIKVCSFFSIALVFVWSLTAYFLNNFYAFNSLSNTVANFMFILIVITHLTIVVESFCQKEAQVKLIQNITLSDQLFNTKLKVIMPYHREKCEIFARGFILILTVLLAKIIIAIYAWDKKLNFSFMYPAIYSILILRLRSIQILFFVYLLRNRLILINDELKNIQSALNVQFNEARSSCCIASKILISSKSSVKISINDRIMYLKQIYKELYESCELINKAFGWSLLSVTTQAFVDFTSNCYWGYLRLQYFRGFSINLLVPDILLLGTLAFYCSSCFQYVSI